MEGNDMMNNILGNFIFDMDEVLVNIGSELYKRIRLNWRKYRKWFRDLGSLTEKQILNRPHFHLIEWLLKDSIKGLPEKERSNIEMKIYESLKTDCFGDDLYGMLNPTEFARKTLMNKVFIEHIRVNKVYILTRCLTAEMIESKKKFVKRFFSHPKIELIIVGEKDKKSDIIKNQGIMWNILIDDELRNIQDFSENLDIKNKEFLLPAFGYNRIPVVLDILIKEKGGTYNYYEV